MVSPPKNVFHRCWSNSNIEDYEMSKIKDGHARGKYTLEFKLEAVRRVKGG